MVTNTLVIYSADMLNIVDSLVAAAGIIAQEVAGDVHVIYSTKSYIDQHNQPSGCLNSMYMLNHF
jgi:hypothetical protein